MVKNGDYNEEKKIEKFPETLKKNKELISLQNRMALFDKLCSHWTRNGTSLGQTTLASPKMRIQNAFFASESFRKVHVEFAATNMVDIVHSVAFPRVNLDVPVLGIDLVRMKGAPSMAIADVSFASEAWIEEVLSLQRAHGIHEIPCRNIPEWGSSIFSEACAFLDKPPEDLFDSYAMDLVDMYTKRCSLAQHCWDKERLAERQRAYCRSQLKNLKTRHMLSAAFGADAADTYMREVMFPYH